jgi:hypothetical protein
MAVVSDTTLAAPDEMQRSITEVSPAIAKSLPISWTVISFGDIEASLSAIGFAGGVIFLTKLTISSSSLEVAGASMLTSGLILVGVMVVVGVLPYAANNQVLPTKEIFALGQPLVFSAVVFLFFSLLPFIGSLSYSTGLSRIGASLTSTIGSSSILMTVMLQLILREFGINTHLPENIFLAIFGGVTGFLGICVIHIPSYSMPITKKE